MTDISVDQTQGTAEKQSMGLKWNKTGGQKLVFEQKKQCMRHLGKRLKGMRRRGVEREVPQCSRC